MDNYVFSKIIINNFQISILDGQTDNPNAAHYNIDLTKLRGVEETLLPSIQNFTIYYSETNIVNHWYYNEYKSELADFLELYLKSYPTPDNCFLVNEYFNNNSLALRGEQNLFILCGLNPESSKTMKNSIIANYQKLLINSNIIGINYVEMGRALGIFYYRPDFSEPKLLNLRFFNQSLFFYSSPPDCLEEAFSYSLIQNCQTSYPVPIPQRFELIFDKRCCLSYERTVSGEFSVEEVICSFRQNLETCILEIRQIEKELELNCVKLLNPKKREIVDGNMDFEIMTLPEAMSQLTKEDLIIEKILGQEVVVEESIKCCVCEADKNRNSTNNSTQNGTENGTSFFMF